MMLNDNDEQQPIMCKLDTGADANVMSIDIYESLFLSPLQNCQTKLCGFGNSVVYPLGVTTITCLDKLKNVFALQFYVTDVFDSVILGEKACFTLNLLKRVDIVTPDVSLTLPQIHNEYADIFTGIGAYDKEYHICIQDTAEGVIVVSASGSETSVSSSTPISAIIYDAYTSATQKSPVCRLPQVKSMSRQQWRS